MTQEKNLDDFEVITSKLFETARSYSKYGEQEDRILMLSIAERAETLAMQTHNSKLSSKKNEASFGDILEKITTLKTYCQALNQGKDLDTASQASEASSSSTTSSQSKSWMSAEESRRASTSSSPPKTSLT